jgi:hypothetical protein
MSEPRDYKQPELPGLSHFPMLGRTRFMAHLQRVRSAVRGKTWVSVAGSSHLWRWLGDYARGMFRPRYKPYPTYAAAGIPAEAGSDSDTGIYPLRAHDGGKTIAFAVASDWGTGTAESAKIAERMAAVHADYTLHLGDVYYIGDEAEVRENFLGETVSQYLPVAFPKGKVGTLSLMGNHEMYFGGKAYFTRMLPYCTPGNGKAQRAAFWCLESDDWRIVGLDTGYNSVGWPILGSIPKVDKIGLFNGDCRMEDALMTWLRDTVQPQQKRKATLLLSHHQYFTAFKDEVFPRPARQMCDLFRGQQVVWLWGHEHRMAVYDRYSPDGNIDCMARCIGHGGMPTEQGKPVDPKIPLVFYDTRPPRKNAQGTTVGWNGYLRFYLTGPELRIEYRDIDDGMMYAESFTATGDGGFAHTLHGSARQALPPAR